MMRGVRLGGAIASGGLPGPSRLCRLAGAVPVAMTYGPDNASPPVVGVDIGSVLRVAVMGAEGHGAEALAATERLAHNGPSSPEGAMSGDRNKGRGPRGLLRRVERGLHELYATPYRRAFARARRDQDDLFMLLVFAESLGVPNPAAFYTLELLPVVYDRFHEWHVRMGMERSPLDHISCC